MTSIRIFDVGGFVRDELLGLRSKDRDCSVVIDNPPDGMTVERGFGIMRAALIEAGFKVFKETPEHGTIRAHPPEKGGLTADFVLARREGPYSDGRRPDWVEIGTFEDDIHRRDFTVNAIARDCQTDEIIDLVNGRADIETMTLRFVGDPAQRIREDALRVMRAIRFVALKGFTMHPDTLEAISAPEVPELLAAISEERREEELRAMCQNVDSIDLIDRLHGLPRQLLPSIFHGRVRVQLMSTLKK